MSYLFVSEMVFTYLYDSIHCMYNGELSDFLLTEEFVCASPVCM